MKKFGWMLMLLLVSCSPGMESTALQTDPQTELQGTERAYEWYLSQEGSGPYEAENCGPAVAAMGIHWYDPEQVPSIEYARSRYRPQGGWWYTSDIEALFKEYSVPLSYRAYVSPGDLTKVIDQGYIAILCLDTRFITPYDEAGSRIGRHYEGDFGHFAIAKGYEKIEGKLYIEVYDPWNMQSEDEDGTPKGKDRLYPAQEVDLAIRNWWPQMMVIGAESEK